VLAARALAECSRFDPERYTSAKSPRNHAATSPITVASGRKHAVVARHVRKAATPQRPRPLGRSVPQPEAQAPESSTTNDEQPAISTIKRSES